MKPYLQTPILGLSILLIFNCLTVNADTATRKTSEVEYYGYEVPSDPEGQKYHRFFSHPAPGLFFYDTQQKVIANIDDTPEKETIVPILVDGGERLEPFAGYWSQAFLLILDETEVGVPKKKAFFKLYDTGELALEVPAAESIELHSPAFVFQKPPKDSHKSIGVGASFIDLTGDGLLDVWLDVGTAVIVISFQNGEFKVVFSCYTY